MATLDPRILATNTSNRLFGGRSPQQVLGALKGQQPFPIINQRKAFVDTKSAIQKPKSAPRISNMALFGGKTSGDFFRGISSQPTTPVMPAPTSAPLAAPAIPSSVSPTTVPDRKSVV